jgi:hypothetical protein
MKPRFLLKLVFFIETCFCENSFFIEPRFVRILDFCRNSFFFFGGGGVMEMMNGAVLHGTKEVRSIS